MKTPFGTFTDLIYKMGNYSLQKGSLMNKKLRRAPVRHTEAPPYYKFSNIYLSYIPCSFTYFPL